MEVPVGKLPAPAAGGADQTFRVFVLTNPDYSLSIREGIPVLVPTDTNDRLQSWIKVDKFGEWMKDEAGIPGFSLVNMVTGQALKHPLGGNRSVQLAPYSQNYVDESVLWTGGAKDSAGYQAIRMINNIELNLNALFGDGRRVDLGVLVTVCEREYKDNEKWNMVAKN